MIEVVHKGADASKQAICISAHRGINSTVGVLSQRYYFKSIKLKVTDFIQSCEVCQKVTPPWVSCVPEMKPISVPKKNMEQIGVCVMELPEVQGKQYIVVAVDYFSKWSEAKALKNKTGIEVAKFM